MAKTSFQCHLGDVMQTLWGTFQGRLLDVRLGRAQDVISRRSYGVRLGRPRDGKIKCLDGQDFI